MKIHEYQGKEIFRKFGMATPRGIPAFSVDEAVAAARSLGGDVWVVKAQIHAGGRGKGGGVKVARSADEVRECAGDSPREAAMEIDRIVGGGEPLYLYGFGEEPAPLLFYLDRDAPPVGGKLGDAPPGYVIVPAQVWRQHKDEALDLTPIFQSTSGRPPIVLLRHGKALASQ